VLDDRQILRNYIKAVSTHWWAVLSGLVLTILDGVERIFGAWYLPPRWAKITTAVIGLTVAQYLAYRDLACQFPDATSEFKQQLRTILRDAQLEWSLIDKPDSWIPEQTLCKQVDGFRHNLATLYSQSPPSWDSAPLRAVIEQLDATKHLRMGTRIPSRNAGEQICEQMRAALSTVGAMIEH
jgi:hypothetical protein